MDRPEDGTGTFVSARTVHLQRGQDLRRRWFFPDSNFHKNLNMDSTEKIVIKKQIKQPRIEVGGTGPESVPPVNFQFHGAALGWGLTAGLLMGVYLLFLQLAGAGDAVALKFLKYLILAGCLGWGLWRYRSVDRSGKFFSRGIVLGALTTFYAAVSLIAVGFLAGAVAPELAFEKFSLRVNSPGDLLVTNIAIFFEVLVFGLVITFIGLQYLKNRSAS